MPEIRLAFETARSVHECAALFPWAIAAGSGAGPKALPASGVLEFFTPSGSPFASGETPDFQYGAFVPDHHRTGGASRESVRIYVKDRGTHREVQLIGSTRRLLASIAASLG